MSKESKKIKKKLSEYIDKTEIETAEEAHTIAEVGKTVAEMDSAEYSTWVKILSILAPIIGAFVATVYTWNKELYGNQTSTAGKEAQRSLFNFKRNL